MAERRTATKRPTKFQQELGEIAKDSNEQVAAAHHLSTQEREDTTREVITKRFLHYYFLDID